MSASPRFNIELMQVESRIRQCEFRLENALMTEKERVTLTVVYDDLQTNAQRLRDLIAWELELAGESA